MLMLFPFNVYNSCKLHCDFDAEGGEPISRSQGVKYQMGRCQVVKKNLEEKM
jgi:hypothetical protein